MNRHNDTESTDASRVDAGGTEGATPRGDDAPAPTSDDTPTMRDVSHTHPFTGETAGRLFSRGPFVAADGGEANVVEDESTAAESTVDEPTDGGSTTEESSTTEGSTAEHTGAESRTQTMKDVSHTPPHGGADASHAFERGVGGASDADPEAGERHPPVTVSTNRSTHE